MVEMDPRLTENSLGHRAIDHRFKRKGKNKQTTLFPFCRFPAPCRITPPPSPAKTRAPTSCRTRPPDCIPFRITRFGFPPRLLLRVQTSEESGCQVGAQLQDTSSDNVNAVLQQHSGKIVEEFEFKVYAFSHLHYQPIMRLPRCEHGCLKNMRMAGFIASTGQLEFLLHIVESASILEVLTIEASGLLGQNIDYEEKLKVEELARRYLDGINIMKYKALYFIRYCTL